MKEQQNTAFNYSVLSNGVFVYPKSRFKDVGIALDELQDMVTFHKQNQKHEFKRQFQNYIGNHEIFELERNTSTDIDNRIAVNLPKYVVDTFNGYFIGVPPSFSAKEDKTNQSLQNWLNSNNFSDLLNEISKQVDIYGRSYLLAYIGDEDKQAKATYLSPQHSFMIYSNDTEQLPLGFVTYLKNGLEEYEATLYTSDQVLNFTSDSSNFTDISSHNFGGVPVVEFYENIERTGIISTILDLSNELDKAVSQKANQNEYFDNAYLVISGGTVDEQDIVKLKDNRTIVLPEGVTAGFLTKPDNDSMQENHINRITNLVYQTAQVANLEDSAFSGNSSGVALQYKLLPMQNKAMNKERKFSQQLRYLFKLLFTQSSVVGTASETAYIDVSMTFKRNLPTNYNDEAETAQKLSGIVSKDTQLSVLTFVKDAQAEVEKMKQEQKDQVQQSLDMSRLGADDVE